MASLPTCRATLSGHSGTVNAAAFSPDCKTVVTGSEDGTAKLWDATSGKCRATLSDHGDRVRAVTFSLDGESVVTVGIDNIAKVWDAASGACRATSRRPGSEVDEADVFFAAFSSDGKTVVSAGCENCEAMLWDAISGAHRATLSWSHQSAALPNDDDGEVRSLAISPDGKTVINGTYRTVMVWDVASRTCRATFASDLHPGVVALSPDSKTVAITAAKPTDVTLWDLASSALRVTLSGHSCAPSTAAFSPDGKTVVTGSQHGTVMLWDAVSGTCRATLSGHNECVFAVAFSPDGKTLVTTSSDNTSKLWDLFSNASADVPFDVAALLSQLSLSSYGVALVSQLGVTSVADLRLMTETHLKEELPSMKVAERLRLLDAVSKLGNDSNRFTPIAQAAPAAAGAVRVRALVVGINAYTSPVLCTLDNAVADAHAVHDALSVLPGAQSTLVTDCTKAAFEQALTDFRDGTGVCKGRGMRITATTPSATASDQHTLGIVYFAGHGLQVSGRNYLVPSDFRVPNKNEKLDPMLRDTARACIGLDLVEEILEDAGITAGAVLLDCCRNVPDFLADLGAKRSVGTRALPAGMGDAKLSLADLMVTFATAPVREALDRSSRMPGHSPFTAALLKALAAPRRLVDLNPFLTDEVSADTSGKQRPHVGGSYGTEAGNLMLG
jgi:hypothetical protein